MEIRLYSPLLSQSLSPNCDYRIEHTRFPRNTKRESIFWSAISSSTFNKRCPRSQPRRSPYGIWHIAPTVSLPEWTSTTYHPSTSTFSPRSHPRSCRIVTAILIWYTCHVSCLIRARSQLRAPVCPLFAATQGPSPTVARSVSLYHPQPRQGLVSLEFDSFFSLTVHVILHRRRQTLLFTHSYLQ